jgi:RNA exonuclease 1
VPDLYKLLGTTPKASADAPAPAPIPAPTPEALALILENLNTQLKKFHSSLPPRTAVIIFTGHSDPRRMASLNARKSAFEAALRSGKTSESMSPEERWTAGNGRELEEAVEMAKRGLLFLGIKA